MADQMEHKGISIDIEALEQSLNTKVVLTSTRTGEGIEALKKAIKAYEQLPVAPCVAVDRLDKAYFDHLSSLFPNENTYKLWLIISHNTYIIENYKENDLTEVKNTKTESEIRRMKQKETIIRYQCINETLKKCYVVDQHKAQTLRARLDRLLIHPVLGYVIFTLILLVIFQAVFTWSSYPMDAIEAGFDHLISFCERVLPEGALTDLLTKGILSGISGIVVFVPQIAILFTFISLLEESGYMSRVVFLMDNIMRRFGLNGKSVVPLISGAACAIPAVMIARNIENWKERLITILVTPFITCSARLPVYLIIINLVIPEGDVINATKKGNLINADWLFVDESSMIDSRLALALLDCVKSGTRVTFIGDPNQLPPVSKGCFFYDIIDSGAIPVANLTTVHRQANGNDINDVAHAILSGTPKNLSLGQRQNVKYHNYDHFKTTSQGGDYTQQQVNDMIQSDLVKRYVDLVKKNGLQDVLIITAKRKNTSLSSDLLNQLIRKKLFPKAIGLPYSHFVKGERVMGIENKYERDRKNRS